MQERRKNVRRRLAFPAVALDSVSGLVMGHIANITTEGVMLRTEESIDIDHIFDLQIPLPDQIEDCERLQIRGHSLWCQRTADAAHYVTGLELLNLSASEIKIIELLIQDAIFQRWIS